MDRIETARTLFDSYLRGCLRGGQGPVSLDELSHLWRVAVNEAERMEADGH